MITFNNSVNELTKEELIKIFIDEHRRIEDPEVKKVMPCLTFLILKTFSGMT